MWYWDDEDPTNPVTPQPVYPPTAPNPTVPTGITIPKPDSGAGTPTNPGGDGGDGSEEGEWMWPGYQGPRSPNYGKLPKVPLFKAPVFDWTSANLYMDPGFQFRLKEGTNALERSAAGRGVLRTGGTLKDILGWGQNFASQEYSNAFDRALRAFDTRYTGAKDEYSPLFSEWQARFNAEKSRADKEWQTYWDDYVLGEQIHAQIGAE